ncbi:tetratricopeptide repeat protein [Methanocaldococcus infernus]|nr:tetratricopeptide repeat protein [Methanocaldococcus infernus]
MDEKLKFLEALYYLLLSYKNLDKDDITKALYYIEMSINADESLEINKLIKALIMDLEGKINKEIEICESLLKEGKNPIVKVLLMNILMLVDSKKALEYIKNLEFKESIILSLTELLCLESLGKFKDMIEICDRLLIKYPDSLLLLTKKAYALRGLGRYEEALSVIEKGLELDPDNRVLLYMKGSLLRRLGNYHKAYETFKKLIDELNVRWLDAIKHLVSLCLVLGKFDEAVKYAKMGLEIRDDDTTLWYYLGQAYEELGEENKAIEAYNRCVALYPDNVRALLNLARLYEERGEMEKAVNHYEKAMAKRHKDISR